MDSFLLFYLLLSCVAFLYASVGHGGASGYLALMALFEMTPGVMKPTALVLNLFVSAVAFVQFYRAGHFRWKLFLPFAMASVPFSYLGGLLVVDGMLYKRILGVLLLIPIIRFLGFGRRDPETLRPHVLPVALLLGAVIGLLSGMIGIGGGILLSPLLVLLHWANQKQAAAVSSLFIFVNSAAGLAGQLQQGIEFTPGMYGYVAAAIAGGLAGASLGARRFNSVVLRTILAGVLAIAMVKLLASGT